MLTRLTVFIVLIGIFGCVTNLIFISALPSIFVVLLIPFVLFSTSKIPKTIFWLYLFFFISILSTLMYYPISFNKFDFYRYDGNFIISFLPLLVVPFFSFNFNFEKLLYRFVIFTSVLNLVLVFIYYTRHTNISISSDPSIYTSLFKASNAAGGFFSIVSGIAFIFFINKKTFMRLTWFLLNIGFLVITNSRGSILGILFGIICYYLVINHKQNWIITIFLFIISAQVYILYQTYPVYDKYIRSSPNVEDALYTYIYNNHGEVGRKYGNTLIRAYENWPRGLDCFLNSPIVGTGFGSVNDLPLTYKEIIPLISVNNQTNKSFNSAHAHHSFLHILGEQGILGLIVLLLFWVNIYYFLKKNNQIPIIRNVLILTYFNLTFMSFTEHRLTTPSNALPFILMLSLYFVQVNHFKKVQNGKR